ncbi:MAG: sugar transferase [Gammaproteobacteria bacterium]|nr:sugar transferase [Gammaproteobacteria bacterium]
MTHRSVHNRISSSQTRLLPKPYFLKHLRIEKRRAERSKAPLTIALIKFENNTSDELDNYEKFIIPLSEYLRETDIIGYVDHNVIGVIFPHTTQKGAEQCVSKLTNGYEKPPFSIVTATFPDQLFHRFSAKQEDPETLSPYFLEDSTESIPLRNLLKRGVDIVGSLLAILILSPVMLITALIITTTSTGPVLFKQIRLGRKGVPFTFYKFRSMRSSVDESIHREYITKFINGKLEEINQGDMTKPLYKLKSDPRVTRIGRIIRKTSIDELPQLFNVLRGDMSLVGPRPPLPYEAEQYQSWHLRRILEMKPGITGLWQVEGRSETSFDDMVRLDLRYIRSCSFMLDVKILIKTVKVVIQSIGAH